MQMVKKVLFFSVLAWLAVLVFMPRIELYHTLEKVLAEEDIRLNESSIEEGIFSLNIKDITVYVKGIAIAHIDSIVLNTYLFYNTVSINTIKVDASLHKQVPAQSDKIDMVYSLMRPLTLVLDANGTFGTLTGEIHINEKNIKLEFIEAKDIAMLKTFLSKGEKGWIYEKSF